MAKWELPEGWVWVKIVDIADTSSGGTPSRKNSSFYTGSIPWVKSGELNDGFVSNTEEAISEEAIKYSSAKVFPKGTLCMAMYGATVGKLGILEIDAATNQAVCGIHNYQGIDTKYMFFYLKYIRDELLMKRKGGAQPNISQAIIRETDFPLAPQNEQIRIAKKIDELFARSRKAREELEQIPTLLDDLKKSVLSAASRGELSSTRKTDNKIIYNPIDYETLNIERCTQWELNELDKYKQKGKLPNSEKWKSRYTEFPKPDSGDLPILPEGWKWINLGQIVWSVKDGPHYSPKYVSEGVPFISGGNVRPEGIDFENVKYISPELNKELQKRITPEKGDILYTKGGTTGIARVNTYDLEFNVWVHIAVLKLIPSVNPFFVQHMLNSPFCYLQSQKFTHGVGNQDLGLTRMVYIKLPLPPIEEQNEIVLKIDELLALTANLEERVKEILLINARMNPSILKRAFSGILVDTDAKLSQSRNEEFEGADALLDRIMKEKDLKNEEKTKKKRIKKKEPNLADTIFKTLGIGAGVALAAYGGYRLVKYIEGQMDAPKTKTTSKQDDEVIMHEVQKIQEKDGTLRLEHVLQESNRPLKPEELFANALYQKDDIESIERFYERLRDLEADGIIQIVRHEDNLQTIKLAASS